MRQTDFVSAQRPDLFIANSRTVSSRIDKYYRRDAVVIYPPVAIPNKKDMKRVIKNYYVYVGRLYRQKGIDLLINTFNKTGKKLIVIGTGREYKSFLSVSKSNIIFKGYLSELEKNKIVAKAMGLIFPAIDEDFGIVPVEAMALGVPVIAYYSGGVRESVIEGKTGIFFHEFSSNSLINALKRFERMKFDPSECYRQSEKFSVKKFENRFVSFISVALDKTNNYEKTP